MRLEKAIEAWADQIGPYDVVYSIGAACGCASWLRTLHLRQMAGPVDWVKGGEGLLGRVAMIEARFAGWLRPENMRLVGGDERTRFYEDKATGIVFPHDFPTAIPFRQALAEAQERYRRRQERFYRTVGEAERTLLVWFSTLTSVTDQEAWEAVGRLRALLGKGVDLLVVDHLPTLRAGEVRASNPTRGVFVFRLNLRLGWPNIEQDVFGDAHRTVRRIFRSFRLRPDLARGIAWFYLRKWLARKGRKVAAAFVPSRCGRRICGGSRSGPCARWATSPRRLRPCGRVTAGRSASATATRISAPACC